MAADDTFQPLREFERHRDVVAIDHREMKVIASMETIAQRYAIVLACAYCRQPFIGVNAPQDATLAIQCGCRELKAENKYRKAVESANN